MSSDRIEPPSDSIGDLEMFHLNGTVCVAGWDRRTGLCWEGGGPVTPYPDVRRWLSYLIDDAISNGMQDRG